MVAWEDLTHADHAAMAAICAEEGFPRQLSPYQDPDRLEQGISTVLRWGGRAAGWLTVHRISFDTVQYSALYLHPNVRGHKLYWALLREAARRRLADPDLQGAIFAIAPGNEVMRGVIDGPMKRHFVQRSELRVSSKALRQEGLLAIDPSRCNDEAPRLKQHDDSGTRSRRIGDGHRDR